MTKNLKYGMVGVILGVTIVSLMALRITTRAHAESNDQKNNVSGLAVSAPIDRPFRPPAQTAPRDKSAEEVYKNIQVFRGLPSSQLLQAMFFMEGALGVGCTNCHVNFREFERDDNPNKQIARKMIQMVRELNQNKFGGERAINCNTCHRGSPKPIAPLAFAAIKNSSEKKAAASSTGPSLSTADEVFQRYVAATGGKAAHEKLTSSVMAGSMLASEGWTAPLKIITSAPNKMLVTFEISWVSYHAFNGAVGWSQDNHGVHDVTGANLALLKREGALFQPMRLKEQYASLTFAGKEMLNNREAYVIEGVIPEAGPEKLYFDIETGLLVRITSITETNLGPIPRQIDLEDYQETDGVKIPFWVIRQAPDFTSAYKIDEVKHNAAIKSALFDQPDAPLKGLSK